MLLTSAVDLVVIATAVVVIRGDRLGSVSR